MMSNLIGAIGGKSDCLQIISQTDTKKWLLNDVANQKKDKNVPTLILKLDGTKSTVEDDENILAECVQRSKKGNEVDFYKTL